MSDIVRFSGIARGCEGLNEEGRYLKQVEINNCLGWNIHYSGDLSSLDSWSGPGVGR